MIRPWATSLLDTTYLCDLKVLLFHLIRAHTYPRAQLWRCEQIRTAPGISRDFHVKQLIRRDYYRVLTPALRQLARGFN